MPTANPNSPLLDAALSAAARGWHVFPLRPGTKRPALHGYDRCPRTGACEHGHQGWERRATTDPDRVRAAWSAGEFNIGLACGPSDLVVIDLDTAKPDQVTPESWAGLDGVRDGQDVFAVLAERAGQPVPGDTFTAATPSGGLHLYFRAPEGVALRNTAGDQGNGLGWLIDTRAHGGYVVAPGSTVDGRAYTVVLDTPPALLPEWLLHQLRPAVLPTGPRPVTVSSSRQARYLDVAIAAESAKVNDAPTGQRNAALFAAALALGQLAAGGAITETDVETALIHAAARPIALGAYSEHQARQTIRSGIRTGAANPRKVAA